MRYVELRRHTDNDGDKLSKRALQTLRPLARPGCIRRTRRSCPRAPSAPPRCAVRPVRQDSDYHGDWAPVSGRGPVARSRQRGRQGSLDRRKELVMCSAAWSNERWPFFGVEEFPDLEAVQRHEQILTDLNWARYIDSRTTLGTELILPQ